VRSPLRPAPSLRTLLRSMIAAALCRIAARSDLVAVLRSDTGRGDKARGSGPRWSWPVFSLGAATPILALAYGSR